MPIRIEDRLTDEQRTELRTYVREQSQSARDVRRWLAGIGHDVSDTTSAAVRARLLPADESRVHASLKLDHILKPEDIEPYRALIRDGSTGKARHAWLLARGYQIGIEAVRRHGNRAREEIEAMRRTAAFACEFTRAAREQGPELIAEATVLRFERMLMERMEFKETEPESLSVKDLTELSRSVAAMVTTRQRMERVRRDCDRAWRREARADGDGAKKSKATSKDVAERMREMLGLNRPAPPPRQQQQQPSSAQPRPS